MVIYYKFNKINTMHKIDTDLTLTEYERLKKDRNIYIDIKDKNGSEIRILKSEIKDYEI